MGDINKTLRICNKGEITGEMLHNDVGTNSSRYNTYKIEKNNKSTADSTQTGYIRDLIEDELK